MIEGLSTFGLVLGIVGGLIAVIGPSLAAWYAVKAAIASALSEIATAVKAIAALSERIDKMATDMYEGNGQAPIKSEARELRRTVNDHEARLRELEKSRAAG